MAHAIAALELANPVRRHDVHGTCRRCSVLVPVPRRVDLESAGEPFAIIGRSGFLTSTPRP